MIALLLLAIALSMDAFAVAIGWVPNTAKIRQIAVMAGVYFGVFRFDAVDWLSRWTFNLRIYRKLGALDRVHYFGLVEKCCMKP